MQRLMGVVGIILVMAALWLAVVALLTEREETLSAHLDEIAESKEMSVVSKQADSHATQRAYDGAPPVIPHPNFGVECTSCHTTEPKVDRGSDAPHIPHAVAEVKGRLNRCQQCHVFAVTTELFVENEFQGLGQGPQETKSSASDSAPAIPHRVFMRENCLACHASP